MHLINQATDKSRFTLSIDESYLVLPYPRTQALQFVPAAHKPGTEKLSEKTNQEFIKNFIQKLIFIINKIPKASHTALEIKITSRYKAYNCFSNLSLGLLEILINHLRTNTNLTTLIISDVIQDTQDLLNFTKFIKNDKNLKLLIFKENPYLQPGTPTSLFHITKVQTKDFRQTILENTNIQMIKFEGKGAFLNKYFTNLTNFKYANLKYLFKVVAQGQIQMEDPRRNRSSLNELDKKNCLYIFQFLIMDLKHTENLYDICFGERKNKMTKFLEANFIEREPIRAEDFFTSPPKYSVEMETFKTNGIPADSAQKQNYDVLSMSDDEMDMGASMDMGAGAGIDLDLELDLEQQHKADDFGFDDILGPGLDEDLTQEFEAPAQDDLEPSEGPMPQAIATIRSFLNTAASKFDTAVKTLETYMPKRE